MCNENHTAGIIGGGGWHLVGTVSSRDTRKPQRGHRDVKDHFDPGLGPKVLTQALTEFEGAPHWSMAGWYLPTVAGQSGMEPNQESRPALKAGRERVRSLSASGIRLNNLGPSTVR